jgi:hypothetical protein
MHVTPVLALGLVLSGMGCSVFAPGEDELGSEYGVGSAGSSGSSGSAGRWCESRTGTLCADFDDQLFPSGWAEKVDEPATLEIDTTSFSSAPAALATALATSSISNEARIRTNVPLSAQRTQISFDLRLAKPGLANGEDFTIAELLCWDATSYEGFGLQFAEPEGLKMHPIAGSLVSADEFPFDQWVHVSLDIRWGPSGHTSVELDGHALSDENSTFECTRQYFVLQIGLGALGDIGSASAHYDNVLYELTDA